MRSHPNTPGATGAVAQHRVLGDRVHSPNHLAPQPGHSCCCRQHFTAAVVSIVMRLQAGQQISQVLNHTSHPWMYSAPLTAAAAHGTAGSHIQLVVGRLLLLLLLLL